MHILFESSTRPLVCALLLVSASACSWVDSTGAQGSSASSSVNVTVTLRNAEPVSFIEETSLTGILEGEGAELTNWNWLLTDTDASARCDEIDGFDSSLSVSSLDDACTDLDECTLAIDESSGNEQTRFTLQMPKLRAPVALSYQVITTRDDGAQVTREQLLCALSVNEAPLAIDDVYIATRDELRIVNASDADNLLSNDEDDDDVRNQSLQVLTTAVTSPQYAAQFSLDSNGGFIYQPIEELPENDQGYVEDSFVYALTDGVHTVNATAVVRIIDGNSSPERLQRIPDTTITASSSDENQAAVVIELSSYFADPDGDSLRFSLAPDSSSAVSRIATVAEDTLSLLASEDDVGEWSIEIIATDGLLSTSDTFELTVLSANDNGDTEENTEPTVTDISNRIVQDLFSYDVSGFFDDADDDVLTFTATGLPNDITISSTGLITGLAANDNRGTWFVRVSANDNRGGSVTDGFLLVIN